MMLRKGVAVLIRNEKKEFLFVNLLAFKEQYYALPGGGIEAGESADDGSQKQYFGFEFVGKDKDIVSNSREVRAYAWVPEENFSQYLLFQNQQEDTLQQIEQVFLKQ